MYLEDGLAPSSQIVGSLLIPNGRQSWQGKGSERSSNGFDKLKNLINSSITFYKHFQPNLIFAGKSAAYPMLHSIRLLT